LSARRKQKDRREAVFLFVLEDQAQHGEKVGDHVAVHESVAGLALRVISRRRTNSVAFGAKRTFSEPRLLNRIYEYAP
jgi:hypothetical protein